jgi:hypothetical protein
MQDGSQPMASAGAWVGGDLFRGAGGDDLAAAGAAFGVLHVCDAIDCQTVIPGWQRRWLNRISRGKD